MSESTAATLPAQPSMPARAYAFLFIGIIAMALAAIFIRFAQAEGIPSLVIAGGRLTLAALILTPLALKNHRPDIAALTRNELLLTFASGAALAVHFASWIASLEFTSVLISVVLVSTTPLWVGILEQVVLRVRLRPLVIVGLVVALTGGILIGLGGNNDDLLTAKNPVLGGTLALTGAFAMAIYVLIGRKVRAKLPLLPYIWLVYGCAAITLLLAIAVTRTQVAGYPPESYGWILLLALVPQLIGHTSINYALRFISATFVVILTQMESIASGIAAFIFLREQPTWLQILGSASILIGAVLASYGQQNKES